MIVPFCELFYEMWRLYGKTTGLLRPNFRTACGSYFAIVFIVRRGLEFTSKNKNGMCYALEKPNFFSSLNVLLCVLNFDGSTKICKNLSAGYRSIHQ